jgi:hypothetical protein
MNGEAVAPERLRNIFVRCPDGKSFCMALDPSEVELWSIKDRIYQETGVPGYDQFLHYNAKPLRHDWVPLTEFGICEGSTIHVSSRLKGGCFVLSFCILMLIMAAFLTSFCTCGMSLCVVPFLLPFLCILPLFCL